MARKTILIADHDEMLASILSLHLRNEYYNVAETKEATGVLRHLSAGRPPALVLLCANLPGDEDTTVEDCRIRCEHDSIPVVYLAEHRRTRRVQRLLDAIADDAPIMEKPVATSGLIHLVATLLGRHIAAA